MCYSAFQVPNGAMEILIKLFIFIYLDNLWCKMMQKIKCQRFYSSDKPLTTFYVKNVM